MKKIAVASENDLVAEHFGHCAGFMIFDTENGQITKRELIANPGHKPGFLPKFLHELGVSTIISGGMGAGAVEIFSENEIEVIVGATGEAQSVVESYLNGTLQSTSSVCHDHRYHDECGE